MVHHPPAHPTHCARPPTQPSPLHRRRAGRAVPRRVAHHRACRHPHSHPAARLVGARLRSAGPGRLHRSACCLSACAPLPGACARRPKQLSDTVWLGEGRWALMLPPPEHPSCCTHKCPSLSSPSVRPHQAPAAGPPRHRRAHQGAAGGLAGAALLLQARCHVLQRCRWDTRLACCKLASPAQPNLRARSAPSPAPRPALPQEGPLLHFVCSMAAGLACSFSTAPVDLCKTRWAGRTAAAAVGASYV